MSTDLEEIKERVSQCPYCTSLGFEVQEVRSGYARVAATVREEHFNWLGRTHGGWLMSLADYASSIAGNTIPGNYVAVQFNMHFLASPEAGERVEAEGWIVHQGKTLGLVEMKVTGKGGRLIGYATGNVVSIGDRASRPRG